MSELDTLLQEKLEALEGGAPLEQCLEGLPPQEASALRLIAAMQQVSFPAEDEEVASAQRAALLQETAGRLNGGTINATSPLTATTSCWSTMWWANTRWATEWWGQLQLWLDWLLARRELAIGAAFLLVLALAALAWAGFSRPGAVDDQTPSLATASESGGAEEIAAATNVKPQSAGESITVAPREPAVESDEAVVATTADSVHAVFVPILSNPVKRSPKSAVLQDIRGRVEVQAEDGSWSAVSQTGSISADQRLRTGELSAVKLAFFDGSQAQLGPSSEISIDQLDARLPADGFRTIVMTQWAGESEHSVQFRNDNGSRYEVNTPAGSGVARGTKFHVLVTADLLARFDVTEGKVDVTGLSRTVSVVAGQLTTVIAGRAPDPPFFRVVGEGQVSQIGPVWTIAGQSFQTDEHTLIIGDPQVGDLVRVEGHLLPEGGQVADRIILLSRAITNRFRLTGEVESIGDTAWTIAGQTILVTEDTEVDHDVVIGDTVLVEGLLLTGGSLQAEQITQIEGTTGFPFRFVGTVERIGDSDWTISGQLVGVVEETEVDDDISSGDLVVVRGHILEDGTWLAREIESREEDENRFAFSGAVQSMDPWRVAGIPFETREWTVVEPGISVGDAVRVQGVILDDGTWVASSIDLLERDREQVIILIGVVGSVDPWVVNGIPLAITAETVILGEIQVGTLVRVEIQLQADGTWQVLRLWPLHPQFGLGCLILSSPVISIHGKVIRLKYWEDEIELDDDVELHDDIEEDSIVTVPICYMDDGTILIYGEIILIYQPIVIIIPPPPKPNHNGGSTNGNHNG